MTADNIGPLTRAAIQAGRLPAELPAEVYAKVADALAVPLKERLHGAHVKHQARNWRNGRRARTTEG